MIKMRNITETKKESLKRAAEYRKSILDKPPLKSLFLELTSRCNLSCLHCGSDCGSGAAKIPELSTDQYKKILYDVKREFDISKLMLNITGGEPLIRSDFFEIMDYANRLGYIWGMTSNGTLIDDSVAEKLYKSGMRTISISIDGLEKTHDELRGRSGSYTAAMKGIAALIEHGKFEHIQVTTVVNHKSIRELPDMFDIFKNMDITSWRIANIEPIGRARTLSDLLLNKDDFKYLMDFITEKRLSGYPVTYGCCHYLGLKYEALVRDWYFRCNAGIYVASIMSNGDIGACLDIERRPELIQGNVLKDDLKDVWDNRFEIFRRDLSDKNPACRQCGSREFCRGDSYHSWDYDKNEPMLCLKNILFD